MTCRTLLAQDRALLTWWARSIEFFNLTTDRGRRAMKILRPSKIIDSDSNQIITMDCDIKISRAEVDVLIAEGHFVILQPPWAAQDKAPDETGPSNATHRSRMGT